MVPDSVMPVPVSASDSPLGGSSTLPRALNGPRSFYFLTSHSRVRVTWLASTTAFSEESCDADIRCTCASPPIVWVEPPICCTPLKERTADDQTATAAAAPGKDTREHGGVGVVVVHSGFALKEREKEKKRFKAGQEHGAITTITTAPRHSHPGCTVGGLLLCVWLDEINNSPPPWDSHRR